MRSIFSIAPFVRLLPPYLAGVIIQLCFEFSVAHLMVVFAFTGAIFFLYAVVRKKEKFHLKHIYGILFNLFAVAAGLLLVSLADPLNGVTDDLDDREKYPELLLQVHVPAVEKTKSVKIIAQLVASHGHDQSEHLSGNLLVYLSKDSNALQLKKGDFLIVKNTTRRIEAPGNPCEFDFQKYAGRKGILYQAYVKGEEWKLVGRTTEFHLLDFFLQCRDKLLVAMRNSGIEGQDYAVLAALVTGKADDIDRDLMTSYSGAGVVHVLAVSGLHVGLIYMVLMLLLRPFRYNKKAVLIHGILSILFLVFYAGITGFSASVNRSTLMFCVMIFATIIHRRNNIINSICASAFILLLIDPHQVLDVGFQLSYLAVLGIVLLQKKIYRSMYFRNRIFDWAWELSAVSISAQLATFPLCLYYFHQFPTWFLLSNLLVIPISTVLLYGIIVFFCCSWIPGVGVMLANVCASLTTIMNAVVIWAADLPLGIIGGVWISVTQTLLIYLCMIFISVWWFTKKFRWLVFSATLVVVLLVMGLVSGAKEDRSGTIVFHKIKGHSALTWHEGNETVFVHSGEWKEDSSTFVFHLQPYWEKLGGDPQVYSFDQILNPVEKSIRREGAKVKLGQARFWVVDSLSADALSEGIDLHREDVLYIRQNAVRYRDWQHFPGCKVVFDNTCSEKYVRKAREIIGNRSTTVWLPVDGAFTFEYFLN